MGSGQSRRPVTWASRQNRKSATAVCDGRLQTFERSWLYHATPRTSVALSLAPTAWRT
jgi:hypothetical protein